MKRDMDLIRELMLKFEAMSYRPGAMYVLDGWDEGGAVDGRSGDEINLHLQLLRKVGFIESPGLQPANGGITYAGITWAGYDFLDSVRDPEIWRKTKDGAMKAGGWTVDLLVDLGKGFIKKQIEERTGVKL